MILRILFKLIDKRSTTTSHNVRLFIIIIQEASADDGDEDETQSADDDDDGDGEDEDYEDGGDDAGEGEEQAATGDIDDDDASSGDDEDDVGSKKPLTEADKAAMTRRVSQLLEIRPPRVVGPAEELVVAGNAAYAHGDFATAIKLYQRAIGVMQRSGLADQHEDYVSCTLNLSEAFLHSEDVNAANTVIQPALLKVTRCVLVTLSVLTSCPSAGHRRRHERSTTRVGSPAAGERRPGVVALYISC